MKRTTLNATIAAVIAFTLTIGWTGLAHGQTDMPELGKGNIGTLSRPADPAYIYRLFTGGDVQLGDDSGDAISVYGTPTFRAAVDVDDDVTVAGTLTFDSATVDGTENYIELPELSSDPSAPTGATRIYVKDTAGARELWQIGEGRAAQRIAGTSGTLDDAYNNGVAITVDAGAITLTNSAADNNDVLQITKSPAGGLTGDALQITTNAAADGDGIDLDINSVDGAGIDLDMDVAATAPGINIVNNGSGADIRGASWAIDDVGEGSFSSLLSTSLDFAGALTLGGTSATSVAIGSDGIAASFPGDTDIGSDSTDSLTINALIDGDVNLNDGAGASPQLIFESQAGQQAAFSQGHNAAFDGTMSLYGAKFHRDIAVTSAALMELETTNIADDYPALSIDHNVTGGVDAAEIISDSTLAALHLTTSNAAGTPLDVDVAANQTGRVANYDLGTWLGTGNEGAFHMFSDSAATIPAGQFMRLVQGGTGQHAAAISGSVFYASDAAAAPGAGTSFLAELEATNIEALLVDAGNVEIDDTLTVDGDGGGLVLNELFDLNSNANDETFHAETSAVDFAADSAFATLYLNGAGQANNTYGLRIRHATNADANDRFAVFEDNDGDDKISFNAGGAVVHSMDAGSAYAMTGTNPDTLATGMLDMEGFTVTDGYEVANLKLNALAGSGGGNEFSVLTLDVDDDTDAADTIFMINANPSDFTGSSDIIGIVIQNCQTGGSFNATAAGQGVVIDDTSSSTTTDGALDVDGSSITDTYAAARVSVVMEAGGGGNEVISGGSFETDDSSDAAGELHALRIWGDNNAGASETVGIYWEGDQDYFAKLEGATEDGNEVLLTCADVGADYTVTFGSDTGYPILSTADVDGAGGIWANASAFVFEGATADTEETTLAAIDPKQDATVNLPDYSGGLPVVIVQGTTQTSQAGVGTSDVTGTSLSLADGYFNANKALKWTIYGTITGGNAAKIIGLYIDNAMISSMTTQAATTGDFVAEFVMYEHTDYANQDVAGKLLNASDQDFEFDTDTTDFNDGGATTVKCQIQSQHAADTVTVESYRVEMWEE
mgnify:CR=1 FL=1